MTGFRKSLTPSGQTLTEMLIAIPLLFLLAAGAVQFAILFQARNAFDKACGEAARQYAANRITDSTSLTLVLWQDLGSYQSFFNQGSLALSTHPPQTTIVDTIVKGADTFMGTFVGSVSFFCPAASKLLPPYINYTGQSWTVTVNCTPPPLVAVIFPNGIQFKSQLTVLKYPG